MKTRFALAVAVAFMLAIPALAQERGQEARGGEGQARGGPSRGEQPRANQGHIPPAPQKRADPHAAPEEERRAGHLNNTPHVSNNHWYGHDAPNDPRYHLDHPFPHGHFEHFGPSYRYNVVRFDPNLHRFWLPGGFWFEVASWDWAVCSDWCWNCGNDFVVYEDNDHVGWYLLYNVHTGAYVHVQYMGS